MLFRSHVQMGKIYEQQQKWPDAVDQFQRAVAVNPDDPSVLLDLGVVLREAGRVQESAETLQRAMEANPRDSRVPYHLGITLQADGRGPEAVVALKRFLALAPSRYERQIMDAELRITALEN